MNTERTPLFFYQFLGAHSLLIGLLPFFLPVFLWQHGVGLEGLSLLIGVSGLSFVAALRPWQHAWRQLQPKTLLLLTFAFELVLVGCAGWFTTIPGSALFDTGDATTAKPLSSIFVAMTVLGIANGAYNAFFWTTQRSLFLQQLAGNNTGKQYGNFQIFVTVFLKVGILLGGLLLDFGGFLWLLALSAGVSFASYSLLASKAYSRLTDDNSSMSLRQSLTYSDAHGSKSTFALDGIFLYLESHFWTLSLFLVVNEDFSRLGVAVVLLAIVFAALFYLIKNRIDQLAAKRVYTAACWLYAGSWLLRFTLDENAEGAGYLVSLILLTFCSSFFRLAFNKRFFDVARRSGAVNYLLIKSYSSQAYLGIFFLLTCITVQLLPVDDIKILQYGYVIAALLSLGYLKYRDQ
ncbi:MAG: hypothetical protein AB8B84_13005 [Granulosicoccus sp.]